MVDKIWRDRKRYFGLPISFTKYSLSENRLFRVTGFFNIKEEEVLLYRVRDITLSRSFFQRIFRVGTITVLSADQSTPQLEIQSVARPREVKEMIFEAVESAKNARRLRATEILDAEDEMEDI